MEYENIKKRKVASALNGFLLFQQRRSCSFLIITSLFLVFLSSCRSPKDITYLREIDLGQTELAERVWRHNITVRPEDELSILISAAKEPKVAEAFNSDFGAFNPNTGSVPSYIVDRDGMISLPYLGSIYVQGLTRTEVEERLMYELRKYLKDEPIVRVEIMTFRVTLLGEGRMNREVLLNKRERLNLFQLLSAGADGEGMNFQFDLKKVSVIREDIDGVVRAGQVDLTTTEVYDSPYFYLQQNDIVYVRPTKLRSYTLSTMSDISGFFGFLGTISGIVALVLIYTK